MYSINFFNWDVFATNKDSILYQALLPKDLWNLAVDVMITFEKYDLKDHDMKGAPSLTKPELSCSYQMFGAL